MGRYKTGIAHKINSIQVVLQHSAGIGMNLQVFSPLLLSNSELDTKDGRERVGVFSAMLIRIGWHFVFTVW